MEIVIRVGFGSIDQSSLQELFGKIRGAKPKCNGSGQHNPSPGNAESHDDDVLGNAELFERHGGRKDLYTPSRTGCDESGGWEAGVDGGNQDRLGDKVREKVPGQENHRCSDQMWHIGKEGLGELVDRR